MILGPATNGAANVDSVKPGAVGLTITATPRFKESPVEYPARNVVAMIPGSDPKLRDQYVLDLTGDRARVQNFEGVCIARSNKGVGSSFTVRKISFGEGVERVFPLYSPAIDSIEVVRRGAVRRAKLYYLRGRRGKSARIAERRDPRPPKASVKTDA